MPNAINITNQRFGLLVAIKPTAKRDSSGSIGWLCKCDCGTTCVIAIRGLRSGEYRSCGCKRGYHTHGYTKGRKRQPLWVTWQGMIQRCYDPNNIAYERYGGRGIRVCERWLHSFENFLADVGERPPGHSIDRINTNDNYKPGNVRWATPKEQANNRRPPRSSRR